MGRGFHSQGDRQRDRRHRRRRQGSAAPARETAARRLLRPRLHAGAPRRATAMTGGPRETDRAPLQLPPAVREALDRSAQPVRPILPPLPRTIAVSLTALIVCAAPVAVPGVRADAAELGLARLWLPALMRLPARVCL